MPWTMEHIVIAMIAIPLLAGLGYLAATLRLTQKLARLESHLAQAEEDGQARREQVSALQTDNQRLALNEGVLQEQLASARGRGQDLERRLEESQRTARDEQERRHDAEKRWEAAQAQLRGLNARQEELETRLADFKELQQQYHRLDNEHTELKTTQARREEHHREQLAQLGEARQALTKEFENLAHRIFEEKGKTFTTTSRAGIDILLKPFREQIEGFQKRINDVHETSIRGQAELNAEIKKVLDIGLKMSAEATNLTSALKGDSQQRGAWGEAQLRRTLEMSGLVERDHYEVQTAFKDAEGRQKQTDYLIKLPDDKHIIIDSKVSLVAYDRAVGAQSPEEYQLAMAEHVKAVKRHIDDLASKDYTNLAAVHSPSFVLMFMPIEPAYIEALKHNRELFEYGYKKNIVLVSHTTLIPILRTVSNLWMIERSNAEAREISEKAGEIYNQVCVVAERLNRLGGTLKTVSNHYNSAVIALAGQQGLYGKVDRFSQLSAKVTKSLPQLEPAHSDFETERLALIVEPIEETDPEPEGTALPPGEDADIEPPQQAPESERP